MYQLFCVPRAFRMKHHVCCHAAGWAVAVAGCCTSSDRPPTVPVSGTITFDGDPCPKSGVINFSPIEVAAGMPRRPGSGHFETNGQFSVASFEDGDGLVPGKYSVRIDCWKRPPLGDGNPPVSYISGDYRPPEVEVTRDGGPIVFDLDVPAAP
jgi:hypothetical protein